MTIGLGLIVIDDCDDGNMCSSFKNNLKNKNTDASSQTHAE
jgi:hypothetical protein